MASLSTSSLLGIRRASSNRKMEDRTRNAAFCKKHPKHRQSPGVCSICLNERLSLFIKATSSSSSSRRRKVPSHIVSSSSTTSSLSSYCSSSVSSCPSPLVDRRCYLLMTGGGSGSGKGTMSWMTKSRSVAYKVGDEDKRKKKKTKGGFFSGLVGGTTRHNKRVL